MAIIDRTRRDDAMSSLRSPQVTALAEPDTCGIGPSANDDDRLLVARAKADRAAFAALYDRYFDVVYWYCYGRLRSGPAAEDATSQVFTKALAGLQRFRDETTPSAFRSWLFRIAHNVVIDEVRARRPIEPLDSVDLVADAEQAPEERVLQIEEHERLWVLLEALPASQRQIVELRLAGLSGAEIAATLGRTRGAVNTGQSRAVARLRALIDASADSPPTRGGD
jgi:RNA polymerase sigma factor (sigma-70 family)